MKKTFGIVSSLLLCLIVKSASAQEFSSETIEEVAAVSAGEDFCDFKITDDRLLSYLEARGPSDPLAFMNALGGMSRIVQERLDVQISKNRELNANQILSYCQQVRDRGKVLV